jgi:8-oxo-dGTP pyrophosphatase MutT (NUDIX family)
MRRPGRKRTEEMAPPETSPRESPPHDYVVISSRRVFIGRVAALRSDQVAMPGDVSSQRDVVELPGAVGIVALDEKDRVLLVRQYRHPVHRRLWEIPAGLLDSPCESAAQAAERELAEEGNVRAAQWLTLVDTLTSPGMSDETVRILLARDLVEIPVSERHVGVDEEAEMEREWVPLDNAVERCISGDLENGITVAGLLAARLALTRGLAGLRPASAPWRARKKPN